MKQILTLALIVFASMTINAQCTPNEMYADSTGFVFPPPFSEERPDGGIPDTACINQPYEFVLTLKIPETLVFNGIQTNLEFLEVATTGAVSNLPVGMSYACNPPTCKFTPADEMACIVVSGTATDAADIGIHELSIAAQVKVDILAIPVSATFPDNTGLIEGADGTYALHVKAEGECQVATSTSNLKQQDVLVRNAPNPFSSRTTIEVQSKVSDDFELSVYDLLGNRLHFENIRIHEGENRFDFDGSQLDNGMYLYTLSKGNSTFTSKMIIQK